MANTQRDRAKERHWLDHIHAWRRSGRSVRDYCREHHLSEASFYAWRRTLAARQAPAPSAVADTNPPAPRVASFVPVRLLDTPTPTAPIDIVLRGGRVVRVTAGFAVDTLLQVIAALEPPPC